MAISSASPAVVKASEAIRHRRGSSSNTALSRPPTNRRPAAPTPSLVTHFMAAEKLTAPAGPPPTPRALSMLDPAKAADRQAEMSEDGDPS